MGKNIGTRARQAQIPIPTNEDVARMLEDVGDAIDKVLDAIGEIDERISKLEARYDELNQRQTFAMTFHKFVRNQPSLIVGAESTSVVRYSMLDVYIEMRKQLGAQQLFQRLEAEHEALRIERERGGIHTIIDPATGQIAERFERSEKPQPVEPAAVAAVVARSPKLVS